MAYHAVKTDAEITPKDWSVEGRGNLENRETFNYIASDHIDMIGEGPNTRTVSRTLEYAYDDFCVAVVANGLAYDDETEKYLNGSGYWKNVWNTEAEDGDQGVQKSEFTGFPQPRLMNGTFQYQSPRACSPVEDMNSCFLDTKLSTYEGSPRLYSFYAPQDMAGVIEVFGGKEVFTERLDYFHQSQIAYMGNEQGFLTVFQFHYAGRPGKSSEWVHNYIPR
ncbi:Fc.00g039660.m01.CDS01 [Cosmosporella sp. VM-42]